MKSRHLAVEPTCAQPDARDWQTIARGSRIELLVVSPFAVAVLGLGAGSAFRCQSTSWNAAGMGSREVRSMARG
jgi:hypothetical protein